MDHFEALVKMFDLQRALDAGATEQELQEKMVAFSEAADPDDFCLWCVGYMTRDHKVAHETPILQAMGKVLTSHIEAISASTARKAIAMAAEMMGRDANVLPERRQAASDILLALGSRFLEEVLAALDTLFRPDVQADLIWLTTLGHLSRANVSGMVPHLRDIIEWLIPMLNEATKSEVRMALCSVLTDFSESIQEFFSGPRGSSDPTLRKQDFFPIMETAYSSFQTWNRLERNLQVKEAVVNALAALTPLLSPATLRAKLRGLIDTTVLMYRLRSNGEALVQNVRHIVLAALALDRNIIRSSVDTLLRSLHQEICARRESQLPVDAVLSVVTLLATAFPKIVARLLIELLKCFSEPNRAAAGVILAHLLSTAGNAQPIAGQPSFPRDSSSACFRVLQAGRAKLTKQVPEILNALQACLPHLAEQQLRVVIHLVSQHPEELAETLLTRDLALDSSSCALWRALGSESKLSRKLLAFLVGKLSTSPTGRQTLAVISAVQELLAAPERNGTFQRVFPRLFGALLLRMGLSEDIRETFLAVRALVLQAQLGMVSEQLQQESAWAELPSAESHTEGVSLLARVMAQHGGRHLPGIVKVLIPFLSSDQEQHRVTATAFFSELLCGSEKHLRAVLLKNLKRRVQDPSVPVRLQLCQGLRRATPTQVKEHSRELLAFLGLGLQDMDVADWQVVLGTLSALSQVLPNLRQDSVGRDVLAYVLQRVTALLEREDEALRCAGATMLGELCRCQAVTAHIRRELEEALVRLALHLPDASPKVTQAYFLTLNNTGSVPELSTIRRLICKNKEEGVLDFRTFLDDLALWASNSPEALGWSFSCALDCLSSRFPGVRACAAIFTESLIKNTPQSLLSHRWMDQSFAALTRALQEESDAQARSCASQALEYCTASQQQRPAKRPVWKRLFCYHP
ncbi:maestro heat-like repeat-containing protein family member 1 [Amia ocellicauda]|uniref:maestro heat-like repeat-containing protein family member 1 n=1 Tax=Amia ocellicauda TaxID=2972642 RepID=UPI00346418DA